MCATVSIFVTIPADIDALEAWSDECRVNRRRDDGEPARGVVVLGTGGRCDCGVHLGGGPWPDDGARAHAHEQYKARDYRKRGWSEAKIERALAQSRDAERRHEEWRREYAVASLAEWVTFLKGAPAHARVRSVGLFFRNDGRLLSAKYWKSARREQIALASVEPLLLARLDESVIYEFVGGTRSLFL